jgi:hypothetical protein
MLQPIDVPLEKWRRERPIQFFYDFFHLIILFYPRGFEVIEINIPQAFADAISIPKA